MRVGGVFGNIGVGSAQRMIMPNRKFMDMPSICSAEKVPYEKQISRLNPKLRADAFTATAADQDFWGGGDHVRKKRFTMNDEYWARDIDFEILLWQRAAGKLLLLEGLHNSELFSIPLLRSGEVHVTVPYRWAKYEPFSSLRTDFACPCLL